MATSDPDPTSDRPTADPTGDPAAGSSSESRDPDAAGGTRLEDLNDDLPLPNEPVDDGLSADDVNGEAPD